MGATIVPFSEKVAPITTRNFMVIIHFTNVHVHLHVHSEIQTPHFYSLEQLPIVVPHYCQPPGCSAFSRDFTSNLTPQCRALKTEKLNALKVKSEGENSAILT